MKKEYMVPVIKSYNQERLAEIIEAGACSGTFSCGCHSGGRNKN